MVFYVHHIFQLFSLLLSGVQKNKGTGNHLVSFCLLKDLTDGRHCATKTVITIKGHNLLYRLPTTYFQQLGLL